MALLAETLVDEWLNRAGFFTVRGLKSGVDEIDLLAVRPANGRLEARHVEVQVSTNPIAYISPLTDEQVKQYNKKRTSAWARPTEALQVSVAAWANKKYLANKKHKARDRAWPNLNWSYHLVHGKVRHPEELELIAGHGVQLVRFYDVLATLCSTSNTAPKGGAGTDIAEMIAYYESFREAAT